MRFRVNVEPNARRKIYRIPFNFFSGVFIMFRSSATGLVLMSLVVAVPQSAVADTKDTIFGAIAGAVVTNAIRNDQERKKRQQQATAKSAPKNAAPARVTLNGSYTRSERMEIQTALNTRGFSVGTVDGALGPKSRAAISQFQTSIGEPATGQLTRTQFAALMTPTVNPFGQPQVAAARPLNPQEVAMLQQSLQRLGFYQNPITGMNDAATQQAATFYLSMNGRSPANTTPVQTLVMASGAAGFQAPPYLLHEAQSTMAGFGGQPQQPFGAQPQQGFGGQPQQAFGTQQPQQVFAVQQPQGQMMQGQPQAPAGTLASVPQGGGSNLFPAPVQQQGMQQAPAQTPLFAAPVQQGGGQMMPQQQPTAGAVQQQPLFPAPPVQGQQVVPGAQPQVPTQQQPVPAPAPQGGTTALFAAGTPVAPAQQQVVAQQQSSLDIFSPAEAAGVQITNQGAATLGTTPQAAFVPTQ